MTFGPLVFAPPHSRCDGRSRVLLYRLVVNIAGHRIVLIRVYRWGLLRCPPPEIWRLRSVLA